MIAFKLSGTIPPQIDKLNIADCEMKFGCLACNVCICCAGTHTNWEYRGECYSCDSIGVWELVFPEIYLSKWAVVLI